MPEPGDDLGEQLEPIASLVRDQDTKMLSLVLNHLTMLNVARPAAARIDAG